MSLQLPFERGSLADQAFRNALSISGRPFAPAEVVPRDGPELFPAEVVRTWFPAKIDLSKRALLLIGSRINEAWGALTTAAVLERELVGLSFQKRAERGSRSSLMSSLEDVAKSAKRLSEGLKHIRGELLYRRAENSANGDLEAVHDELHRSFHWGEWKRHWGSGGNQSSNWLLDHGEVGTRAGLLPTWLEDALEQLAATAREQSSSDFSSMSPTEGQLLKRSKRALLEEAIAVWTEVTGVIPGTRSHAAREDHLSPFHQFIHRLCGHLVGLLVIEAGRPLSPAATKRSEEIRKIAHKLGLCPVPSASKLARIIASQRTASK